MKQYKIYSTNKSVAHIAGMFYHALDYNGKINKIDVSIMDNPQITNSEQIMVMKAQITCNKKTPYTKDIFIAKASEGYNNMLLNIIGALDASDTRRISVCVIPPNMDISSITHDAADKDVVAILTTPRIDPTAAEEKEIYKFIDFLEDYED